MLISSLSTNRSDSDNDFNLPSWIAFTSLNPFFISFKRAVSFCLFTRFLLFEDVTSAIPLSDDPESAFASSLALIINLVTMIDDYICKKTYQGFREISDRSPFCAEYAQS